MQMNVLAADIGGTNARFGLVRVHGERDLRVEAQETYPSAELGSALEGARRFLRSSTVTAVCVAAAGPVRSGVARLTNLPWEVREDALARLPGVEHARVMNDFEALGHAVPLLSETDLDRVHAGVQDATGPRVVTGAGTGLGQALVVPWESGRGVRVFATEGGHATFAPTSEEEWELRRYLARTHASVTWERILSGDGLHAIYRWLVDAGAFPEEEGTRDAMAVRDPAAVVTERGAEGSDPACTRALDLFMACYGTRVGDVALSAGATGGVYIGGGIAPRLRERFRERPFREAFLERGPMTGWLERVPVWLVVREDAALIGAVAGCSLG